MTYRERIQKIKDRRFALKKLRNYRKKKLKSPNKREHYAKRMRENPTSSEAKLHAAIEAVRHEYGWVLNSQVVLGPYIVDLYLPKQRVVIEVDGDSHIGKEKYDLTRERWLWYQGYRVMRCRNEEVWADVDAVVEKIHQFAGEGTWKQQNRKLKKDRNSGNESGR